MSKKKTSVESKRTKFWTELQEALKKAECALEAVDRMIDDKTFCPECFSKELERLEDLYDLLDDASTV